MDTLNRPRLWNFRVIDFKLTTSLEAVEDVEVQLSLQNPQIELGVGKRKSQNEELQTLVIIQLAGAFSLKSDSSKIISEFEGKFEGFFVYPSQVKEEDIIQNIEKNEPYQYSLVSQVYPLAINHLKQVLNTSGFSMSGVPLGI
jgi:hypothetical protein